MSAQEDAPKDRKVDPPPIRPLEVYRGTKPPQPDWFRSAIAQTGRPGEARVDDASIFFQEWGTPGKQGLLLCHGNGAHSHWYDFVAPYFADDFHVVAMDFAGMGQSDWRESYDLDGFMREQIAVCETAGLFKAQRRPIIVGHSFGGFVTLLTGAEHGDRFEGTVIVDSPVNPPEKDAPKKPSPGPSRSMNHYATLEAALARFRLAPAQDCENHFILDHIARHSLRPVDKENGTAWTWRFDPAIWRRFSSRRVLSDALRDTRCRIAILRGDRSAIMPERTGEYMSELLGHRVPFITIPEAAHHIFLDQPLAFVAALRTLFGEWTHSDPHRDPAQPTA